MDLKLTNTEFKIVNTVHTQLTQYIEAKYNEKWRELSENEEDSGVLTDLQNKLVKQRDWTIDKHIAMADKVAFLLHAYRLNGTQTTTLLEFMQFVFLYEGKDYNDIEQRRQLDMVLQYFAYNGGLQMIYTIPDKSGTIMSVQTPTIELVNNQPKVTNVDLLGNGAYTYEDLKDGSYKCWRTDDTEKKNAVIISADNFRDMLEVYYQVTDDPDISFSMNKNAEKLEDNQTVVPNKFTVTELGHRTNFSDMPGMKEL